MKTTCKNYRRMGEKEEEDLFSRREVLTIVEVCFNKLNNENKTKAMTIAHKMLSYYNRNKKMMYYE